MIMIVVFYLYIHRIQWYESRIMNYGSGKTTSLWYDDVVYTLKINRFDSTDILYKDIIHDGAVIMY